MTTSADSSPQDNEPEVAKKTEPRRKKPEPKKAVFSEASADDSASDSDAGSPKGEEPGKGEAAASKALAPAGVSPVDPFLAAKAEDKVEPPPPPRSFASRMLDYSAHAAIIVGLVGFAWTVSGHVIGQKKGDAAAPTRSAAKQPDEMGDLRLANIKLHEELKALKSSVDALRAASRRDTTQEQLRVVSAGLESVKSNLGSTRAETNASIAQIQSKVDKLAPGKVQALADRIGRLEHQGVDTPSTGSIARGESVRGETVRGESGRNEGRGDFGRSDSARNESGRTDSGRGEPTKASKPIPSESAKAAPKPPTKPAEFAKLDDQSAKDEAKPATLPGWVVRDVYQGVALVEGRRGTMEVVPGVAIPGAGVVKSIERKGGGWVVTTSKGQLAYAGAAAQREQRDQRGYRDGGGYEGGRYGRGNYRYDY